jgi:PBSX family phage terminase large subunit
LQNDRVLEYIYQTFHKTYNIQEGAWRSGKSFNDVEAFCMNMEETPDMLHMAIGETISSAKIILFEGDGMGIKYYPDWQERWKEIDGKKVKVQEQRVFEGQYEDKDALVLMPKRGSNHPIKYIIACGGGIESSYKAFRGYSIGMIIGTEIDLFHPKTIDEIKGRTISSKHRRYFLDFNPTDPRHYIYTDFVDFFIENYKEETNYLHTTMDDNPSLSEERKGQLKREWPEGSVQYQRYVEGKRVVATGLIYPKMEVLDSKTFDASKYISYVIVADPGENASATSFVCLAMERGFRNIDVILDYRHRNADQKGLGIKMPIDYAIDFMDFIKRCKDKMQRPPKRIYMDEDVTFKRECERIQYQYGITDILEGAIKEEIATRIKTGINLIWLKRLRAYDNCQDTIRSYNEAQYDPKESAKGIFVRWDDPVKGTMIDNIDATEYGVSSYRYELSLYKER